MCAFREIRARRTAIPAPISCVLVIFGTLCLFAAPVQAQPGIFPGGPEPTPIDEGATRLPTAGRRETRLFKSAIEHLEAGKADEAVVYLQTILDADADGFFSLDETPARLVSLRAEAARRLDGLAGEARQAYELRYGPTAKSLLDEALVKNDPERLAAVARRFPAAGAGREAAFRLAEGHLDGGEPLAAISRLERLREVVGAAQRGAVLLRLAVGYERLGEAARRDAVLADLAEVGGQLTIAGERVAASDADAVRKLIGLGTALGSEQTTADWPMAGGSPGRANHRSLARGRTVEWSVVSLTDPFRPPDGLRTGTDDRLARWAVQTALVEFAQGRPALPSMQPVASGEAIFFRTPTGTSSIDAATGEFRWRTLADGLCWDYLPEHAVETPNGEAAARAFVGQRLWSDATWGALATDGRLVFAVEEAGAAAPLPPPPGTETEEGAAQPVLPASFNRLTAYDTATGRRVWEAGGAVDENGSLPGAFFLGPPVPAGGRWYALAEVSGVTHLVAIDPSKPDGVLWTQPVAEHDRTADIDVVRRTAGLSPCVVGGLLACPVGPGLVVAVDPATRSLGWAHANEEPEEHRDELPLVPFARDPSPIRQEPTCPEVIAAEHRLLIASPQRAVVAIDPLDGTVVWEVRPRDVLRFIGVDESRVFLQTPTGIIAVRSSDGAPAWDRPAAIGPPSGRGVVIENLLYAPLADKTLAVLDAATGRSVASILSPHDEPFGNLIVVGGTLVSQSATRVVAMPVEEKPGMGNGE